nr:MAG: putative RNA-dependent RNA polymerase [Botourmiaviridae sp.]
MYQQTSSASRGSGEEPQVPGTGILREVASVLGRIFSVRLDVPDFSLYATPEKKVKEFCVGLLENPVNHPWWPAVRGLGVDERTSISASLFLTRKALPSSPDPRQAEKHAKLMSEPAPKPPSGFIEFIDREIDKLFKVGWDRGYASHVFSHSPTSSSCLQYSRKRGGAARWLSEQGADWFSDQCLAGESFPLCNIVKYCIVETGGKQRGVTISDGFHHVLGPLHRTLYDHLAQFKWLLRGDARGKKFSGFQKVEGEVFVSGDYESATDNLSLEVSHHILDRVLRRSRCVPPALQDFALRSLVAEIHYPGGHVVRQRRGQLMGNYLSFPLLCLQNYLAFRFSISRTVPLRINGDDIVFRCRPSELKEWKLRVGAAGLTLSAGKTLVDSSIFSLNSSFFRAGNRRVWEIPVIRPKSCTVLSENPLSGGAFTRFIRGWKSDARRLLGGMWLRHRRSQIQATGRSVEVLGIPADNSQLHTAGLSVRESFYRGYRSFLRLPESPVPPVPLKGFSLLDWVSVPRVSVSATLSEEISWRRQARNDFASSLWQRRGNAAVVGWDDWWNSLRLSGYEQQWLAWKRTTKRVHRMGCRLNLILRPPAARNAVKAMWVPRLELPFRTGLFRGIGVL